MSLSKIVVSGKVIKAPEKRFTPNNNTAVTEFFIAVESIPRADAQPESTPVKITAWRDLAERTANEIKKVIRWLWKVACKLTILLLPKAKNGAMLRSMLLM